MTSRSIEPFKPDHLRFLMEWGASEKIDLPVDPQALEGSMSLTAKRDGMPIACGGFVMFWKGRAAGWAVIRNDCRAADMRFIHRHVRELIVDLQGDGDYKRVEAVVRVGFDAAHKWVRMLGFEAEGIMRAYDMNGNDYVAYAKVADNGTRNHRNHRSGGGTDSGACRIPAGQIPAGRGQA